MWLTIDAWGLAECIGSCQLLLCSLCVVEVPGEKVRGCQSWFFCVRRCALAELASDRAGCF